MAINLSNSIREKLVARLVKKLRKQFVYGATTDGKYVSGLRKGQDYKVPSLADVNIGTYTGAPITRQAVTDNGTAIDVNEYKYFDVGLDAVDANEAEVKLRDLIDEGAYSMGDIFDQFIAAQLVAGAGTVNVATTYDTLNVTGVAMGALVEINTGVTGVSSGTAVIGDGTVIGVQTVLGTLYVNDATDEGVAAAAQAALNTLGVDGAPITVDDTNVIDYIQLLVSGLRKANANLPTSSIVLPHDQLLALQNVRGSTGSDLGAMELKNGAVDKLFGVAIYGSNNTPVGAVSGEVALAYDRRAMKWVDSMSKLDLYKPNDTFEDAAKSLHIYGGIVIEALEDAVVLGYVA